MIKISGTEKNISEKLEGTIKGIGKRTLDEKLGLYKQLGIIIDNAYIWQCAILWDIARCAEHGKTVDAVKEAASALGIAYRTAARKVQIWKTFYQDPEKDYVCQKSSYIFDENKNPETWFRICLESDDPVSTMMMAQKRFLEETSEGNKYIASRFKEEVCSYKRAMPTDEWPEDVTLMIAKAQDLCSADSDIRVTTKESRTQITITIRR